MGKFWDAISTDSALVRITSVKIVVFHVELPTVCDHCPMAPCETHIQKKAKIDPQETEVQPAEDVIEKSSQNCSDSEDSSGSQSSSTVEAEDIESDLESLEEHHYFDLRQYSATLERDFPAHYTTQQLNAQEWDFYGGCYMPLIGQGGS